MGPTTYALCQKPTIGFAMWVFSLCAFPPLFKDAPITLDAGSSVFVLFKAPVAKLYPLELNFEFPSEESRRNDTFLGLRNGDYCNGKIKFVDIPVPMQKNLGLPIPFRVVIRNEPSKSIVVDQIFESLCISSLNSTRKSRTIGWLNLPEGSYSAEVISLEAQNILADIKTSITLRSGYGK